MIRIIVKTSEPFSSETDVPVILHFKTFDFDCPEMEAWVRGCGRCKGQVIGAEIIDEAEV